MLEIERHMRKKTSANKDGINLDYLPVIKDRLTKPLIKDGSQAVEKIIDFMDEYYVTREDFDSILELTTWTGQVDVMTKIDSKVKAAFTRAYNKRSHKNPFVAVDFKKLKGKGQDDADLLNEDEEGTACIEEDGEEKDEIENDTMIKAVRKNLSKSAVASTSATAKKTSAAKPAAKRAAAGETKTPASKKKKT